MAREGAMTSVGLVVAVLFSCLGLSTCAYNITLVLNGFPDYSLLNQWLSTTDVAKEINNRTSVTLLAPSNNVFQTYLNSVPNAYSNTDKIADTLRYHVLLTYFGPAELAIVPANGTSVTTLLQTTGRANETQGFVTLYNNGSKYVVGHEYADSYGNETILGNVTQSPYDYSILSVSAVLAPVPPALPSPAPAPSPLSSSPSPSPSAPTTAVAPAGAATTSSPEGNYASPKGAIQPVVLVAMLLVSVAALL